MLSRREARMPFGGELPDLEGIARLWRSVWSRARLDARRGDIDAIEFFGDKEGEGKPKKKSPPRDNVF